MGDLRQDLDGYIRDTLRDIVPEVDEELDKPKTNSELDLMRLSFVDTLRSIIRRFGGPPGIAKEYLATYQSSSSSVQATMLNRVVGALQEYGEDADLEDAESMDSIEEELRNIIRDELLEQLPEPLQEQVKEYL